MIKKIVYNFFKAIFLIQTSFMNKLFTACFMCIAFASYAQTDSVPTLRSILLEQLKTTHNVKDWFVPPSVAIGKLTPEQANWKDSTTIIPSHS